VFAIHLFPGHEPTDLLELLILVSLGLRTRFK
jgi:hypothetical protein